MKSVREKLPYPFSIFLLRKIATMYNTIQNEELFQQARIQHRGDSYFTGLEVNQQPRK